MQGDRLVMQTIGLLLASTEQDYERAIGEVAQPEGFGVLSDRLMPGLSLGRVPKETLAKLLQLVATLKPEFIAQCREELVSLSKKLKGQHNG